MKTIDIKTAQNVKIQYELGSIGSRFVAVFLDLIILAVYAGIMSALLALIFVNVGDSDYIMLQIMMKLLVYLPFFLYSPLMEYLTKGQTLGKKIMGIRVVRVDGENASFKDYFTRWMFKPMEFLMVFSLGAIATAYSYDDSIWMIYLVIILFEIIDFFVTIVSDRSQRLGDTMANTIVIKRGYSYQYSIRDVLAIKSKSKHTPTYTEAIRFTDEDMMLIKTTIARVEKYKNDETKKFAIELADKTAEHLGLDETPKARLKFLKTVLDDYIVLTR